MGDGAYRVSRPNFPAHPLPFRLSEVEAQRRAWPQAHPVHFDCAQGERKGGMGGGRCKDSPSYLPRGGPVQSDPEPDTAPVLP